MKKDYLAEKEYRYGCSIDCGGTPLRVYSRELGSPGSWNNYEDTMHSPTFVWYNHSGGGSSDYAWLPGHWISDQEPPGEGSMFYQDAFGVQVAAGDFAPQAPMKRLPEYLSCPMKGLDTYAILSLCFLTLPSFRNCNQNEFRSCKEYCKSRGGFYVGCYWENGLMHCVCGVPPDKPCTSGEMKACKEACSGAGRQYIGCVKQDGKPVCLCH